MWVGRTWVSDSLVASVLLATMRTRARERVKDIDRDGDVKIATQSGPFHRRSKGA